MMRLARSIVGPREAAAVSRIIMEDGYLGMGAEVQAFEKDIASFLGLASETVVCVNSGTAALHLALEAVLEPGDEVLVQSLTYLATYQAITAAGAVPISCEINPETLTIDLCDAATKISPRTRAIVPVHYASNPGDLDALYDFATARKLRVIEDAAHAFGCSYKGRKIGSFGDIACFSFDGIKNITSGEGGAIVSRDPLLLSRVKDARLLGVEKDTDKRYASQRSWEFDVKRQGYRYHMSNLFAAIGRVQLERFVEEFAPSRMALAKAYRGRLSAIVGVELLSAEIGPIIPHLQPIRVLHGKRDVVRAALEAEQIQTGIHYKPNHFLSYYGGASISLPITELMYEELLSLPLHPGMNEADVERVCETISISIGDSNE